MGWYFELLLLFNCLRLLDASTFKAILHAAKQLDGTRLSINLHPCCCADHEQDFAEHSWHRQHDLPAGCTNMKCHTRVNAVLRRMNKTMLHGTGRL